MSGWISIDRALFEHDMFQREPMSEREAFIWMLARAAWQDTTHRVGNQVHDVPRGSFITTLRELQSVFMWRSDKRVRTFLKKLESGRTVGRTTVGPKNAPKTHVTICNYDKYQVAGRTEDAPGTHRGRTGDAVNKQINNKQSSSIEEDVSAAVDDWNKIAGEVGWPKVRTITKPRKSHIKARLKDAGGIEGWRQALRQAASSHFLTGQTGSNFKASFDWITKQSNFTKLLEGNYDNRDYPSAPTPNARGGDAHHSLMAGFAQAANRDAEGGDTAFAAGHGVDHTGEPEMDFGPRGDAPQPLLRVIGAE